MLLKYTNSHNIFTRKEKWKIKNANWNTYQNKIDQNIESISQPNTNNIEEDAEKFTNLITNAALDIFELTIYAKRSPVPWWNKNIKQVIREKKTAFDKYKRTLNLLDFILFKKYKALVRYIIKKEKISWTYFTSSLTSQESPTDTWNTIKTFKGIPFTQIKTLIVDQKMFTDPEEIIDKIGLYFYCNSSNSSLNPDFLSYKQNQETIILPSDTISSNQSNVLNESITIAELDSNWTPRQKK